MSFLGTIGLTLSPSTGRAAAFCTVQFSVPFQGIDTLANIALTVPLTLFTVLLLRRPLLVFVGVSALAALIELTQAITPPLGRACDTNDWFMNTVGAALGALLGYLVLRTRRRELVSPASGAADC